MNSKKVGLKLKGFTLIEMLVVITIIAVLAGIVSIAVSGFQRDAKIETNNNKAQMVYSGFQNQLIQCEIKQDVSLFDVDAISATPAYSGKKLTYAAVKFTMSEGDVKGDIIVKACYDNQTANTLIATVSSGNAFYKNMKQAILSFVDSSFEGTAVTYLDVENYTVDSVCYYEKESDYESTKDSHMLSSLMNIYSWDSTVAVQGKNFQSFTNMNEQKNLVKYNGVYCGAYPLMNNFKSDSYVQVTFS